MNEQKRTLQYKCVSMSVGVRQLPGGDGSSAGTGEASDGPASEARTRPAQIKAAERTWQQVQRQSRPEPGHPVLRSARSSASGMENSI